MLNEIEYDVIVKMKPIKQYTKQIEIKSIEKAKPRIIINYE